jgi:endonuclease/exonuclease/phosphatase family metal-dependent hydrolase
MKINLKYLQVLCLMLIALIINSCSEPVVNYGIAPGSIRVATFNTSLFRNNSQELIEDMRSSETEQATTIAEIIQRLRPDVIILNEFDYDVHEDALNLFCKNYLEKNQHGINTIHYPYRKAFPSNTGIPSGVDLNNDGKTGQANDAYGYGTHPGQYAFAILSRYPIKFDDIRSFQNFLWKDMPNAAFPVNADGSEFLTAEAKEVFRLSSKNHVDVPIVIRGKTIHALISHPTPPVFDGPEDLNGKRNHDEIRLWADYIDNKAYLIDDQGKSGGLADSASFIIFGDLNADPIDGDSYDNAINQLLTHPRVNQRIATGDQMPRSEGSIESYSQKEKQNRKGDPAFHTSVYGLRIDYVLPSSDLSSTGTGVFWPPVREEFYQLSHKSFPSDHRFVWVDIHAVF